MAKNDSKVTDNPKLKEKTLSDGQISLYLEYYLGYSKVYSDKSDKEIVKVDRKKEALNLYLWEAPRTPIERQHNKDILELARKIRFEKEQELLNDKTGYRLKTKPDNINFLDYFQAYINRYTKKDIRVIEMALRRFKEFLNNEYPNFSNNIKPQQISREMIMEFIDYLHSVCNGGGAKTAYQRFKKVILYAYDKHIFNENPSKGIVCKVDDQIIRKDVLSEAEITQLINSSYPQQNDRVRKAFIFCLYTGMRFCDVKDLTFSNIDYSNKLLMFDQNKTKGHSTRSGVIINLRDDLLSLIGTPKTEHPREELIFNLPSNTQCLKALRVWTKKAGITKHITWHCARHSFAVNILNNGANIKTVSSLLGHSDLNMTEKYTRAVDSLKIEAINSLPRLNIINASMPQPKSLKEQLKEAVINGNDEEYNRLFQEIQNTDK